MYTKLIPIFFLLATACSNNKSPVTTGLEGKILPQFNILLMDSITSFSTKQIPNDKPFIIFLFSPECPYSRSQMASILNHNEELKYINFYAISSFPFVEVKQFYKEFEIEKIVNKNIIVGLDTSNFFVKYMGIPGVPYLAFYSKGKFLERSYLGNTNINIIKDFKTD